MAIPYNRRSHFCGQLRAADGRVIFCVEGSTMVLLHGFVKKTRKTPKHELDLAIKRLNQLRWHAT